MSDERFICEARTTKVPAIRFYPWTGFRIEGVDISYDSNDDGPDGEGVLFMKKRVAPPPPGR